MWLRKWLCLVLPLLVLFGCCIGVQQLIVSNPYMSFITHLIRFESQDNIIVSPASFHDGLIHLLMGTRGSSAAEMMGTLQLNEQKLNEYLKKNISSKYIYNSTLKMFNQLYVDRRMWLLDRYKQDINRYFNTKVEHMSFGSIDNTVDTINGWIDKKTGEKVKDMLGWVDPESQMVMVTALDFYGEWEKPFDPNQTTKEVFETQQRNGGDDAPPSLVDMMHIKDKFSHGYIEKLCAYVIFLPYKKSNLSMVVLLPRDSNGLYYITRNIHEIDLQELVPTEPPAEIELSFPRFKIEYRSDVSNIIKSMGIRKIFSKSANFSGLTRQEGLRLNQFIHKMHILVDEGGHNASAASASVQLKKKLVKRSVAAQSFTVNHPFFFLIKDKKRIYVAGIVNRIP
ncbi:serine protease inhibitor 42Dd [Drosophila pseudoobscura]|uniref:Serine protease inhibitor 42Dd n=1 Tax=Drosophila pseudoobscura pseudoobscura TaxID=46245 RepID=A0A6I8V187_DROPS|nr:serine protease inhibitor 42Dd [Drosophila pseudoobscura]